VLQFASGWWDGGVAQDPFDLRGVRAEQVVRGVEHVPGPVRLGAQQAASGDGSSQPVA